MDSPTSRAAIYTQYLNLIHSIDGLTNSVVVILCGSRLDLLSHVRNQVRRLWPGVRPWIIQLTGGEVQSYNKKPGFMVLIELSHNKAVTKKEATATDMPHTLDLLKCNLPHKLSIQL